MAKIVKLVTEMKNKNENHFLKKEGVILIFEFILI